MAVTVTCTDVVLVREVLGAPCAVPWISAPEVCALGDFF